MTDRLTKTLMLLMQNGDVRRLVIPDEAKVTFGHFAPGAQNRERGDSRTLRVYLTKEKQVAVIPGVMWFISLDDCELQERSMTKEGDIYWQKVDGEDISQKVIAELAGPSVTQDGWR